MADHVPGTPDPPAGLRDEASPIRPDRRLRAVDLAVLAMLGLAVRLPAALSGRHLTFDDGVFGASAIAMRHGGVPFRDVFSSQGPLFLPLVWLGDLIGFRSSNGPRIMNVIAGLILIAAAAWVADRLAGRQAGLIAGGIIAISGSIGWVTAPVAADGPALAFGLIAIGFSLAHRDRPRAATALGAGVALGACLSTKAIELPMAVPVALVLVVPLINALRSRLGSLADSNSGHGRTIPRMIGDGALAVGSAIAVWLVVAVPFGLADVWDQSVTFKSPAGMERTPLANARKIVSTLWDRDLVIWWLLALSIVGIVLANRRPTGAPLTSSPTGRPSVELGSALPHTGDRAPRAPGDRLLVNSWILATITWLIVAVTPMFRPHVSAIIPPVAVWLGVALGPVASSVNSPGLARRIGVGLAASTLALVGLQLWDFLAPGPYGAEDARIVSLLEAMPAGTWALSDDPGLVWRAGRRTTDDLVDTSMLRIQQGRITTDTLAVAAADPIVCAVVIRSDQRFGALPRVDDALEALGYRAVGNWQPPGRMFLRPSCDQPD